MALAEERRDKRERTRKKIRKEKRGYCLRLRSVTVFFFPFQFFRLTSTSLATSTRPAEATGSRPPSTNTARTNTSSPR